MSYASLQSTIYSPIERTRSKPVTDTPRPITDPNMHSPKLDMTWDEMHGKTIYIRIYTYPAGSRLANHNRNRNVKPQLDNRNTENGIKMFWKIFHKIFTFFTRTHIRQH